MGVLHGDAGIDLELQFNYWIIKVQTCLTTWIITNVLLSIFIYTLFYFFFLHCVYKMTVCLITITFYIFIFCLGDLMIAADLCLGKISMA